jgi:spermidine/putrescine transport system ATP-binding protein
VTVQENSADLVVEGLSKRFGDVVAVDEVSFELPRGEFFSLLGPSGCGKTTTLRLIAGFESADSGRILLEGKDVAGTPPHRRRVNTVFQQYALFPHMTVEDNVAFGLKQAKTSKPERVERLGRALDTVRLGALGARYPRELSGGQQQRVALARALVNEPAVLLLDEPLAALDLKLRKAMQGELTSLQGRVGVSFLYVTHDQGEALTLSDRIAVMNEGRILQIGTPQEIYERPLTRFVADFIGDTNMFVGRIESVGAEVVVQTSAGSKLRCDAVSWAQVGAGAVVAIRPENLTLHQRLASPGLSLEGTLTRVTYLGDLLQFHVDVPGEGEVVVQRQNGSEMGAGWRVGERATVSWDRSRALVLIDDSHPENAGTESENQAELV